MNGRKDEYPGSHHRKRRQRTDFAGKLPGHQAFQMLPGFRREGLLSFLPLPLSAHQKVSRVDRHGRYTYLLVNDR